MPYYIKRTKAKKKDKPLPLFDKAGVTVKKKPDLVAKLDKVFSRYIRLRDAMPNGMIRCISCGKVKRFDQFDNGHYHGRPTWLQDLTKTIAMPNVNFATVSRQTT